MGTVTQANLRHVCDVFGVPYTTPLTSFRRGAGIVNDIPANAGVPASGNIALTQLVGAQSGTNVSASITPNPSNRATTRGSTISQNFTANVSGGVGPFSYSWSFTAGGTNMTLTGATSATCNVSSSTTAGAVEVNRNATLRCIVTDNGAGGLTSSPTASLSWTWAGV